MPERTPGESSHATAASGKKPRQAVLLIHGIGEQRPMDTLRDFVAAFLKHGTYHSKPDTLSDSFELRRLKLRKLVSERPDEKSVNADWPETDFYEYYWAHQMYGTTVSHVTSWLLRIMGRGLPAVFSRTCEYHRRLKWLVPLIWVVAIGALALFIYLAVRGNLQLPSTNQTSVTLAVLLVAWRVIRWSFFGVVIDFAGDAARYFDVNPKNVARRYDILRGGIDVLGKLHTDGEETDDKVAYRYGRIVLVGHSLGSVIAYDILRHYWPVVNGRLSMRAEDLIAVESFEEPKRDAAYTSAKPSPEADLFRRNQRMLCRSVSGRTPAAELLTKRPDHKHPPRWLVTDLVTLGSPLTYAPILMADGVEDLDDKKMLRELPTCPPDRSRHLNPGHFIVKLSAEADPILEHDIDILHHGAYFALTRWTNLYFDNDLIGGPIAPVFGAGVDDVPLDGPSLRPVHAHVGYWKRQEPPTRSVERLTAILKDAVP